MGKKELREKIRKIGIDYEGVTLGYYEDLNDTETCVKELIELIFQELSKAREEGREEGYEKGIEMGSSMYSDTTDGILEELDKLKDNK